MYFNNENLIKKIYNSKVKLAVLMSIFKKTELFELKRSINSLENQTKIKISLLLYIDGDIKEEVDKFVKNYTPVLSIVNYSLYGSNKCKGLASAMNSLILNNFKDYEYFARQDSDDYSAESRLINQIKFLENNQNIDIVGTGFYSFDSQSKKILSESKFPKKHKYISDAFAYSTPIAHATVLFRKSFFLKSGIYQPSHKTLTEDNRLWLSGFLTGCIFANIYEPLYYVSIDPESYKRRSNLRQIIAILKIRINYIIKRKFNIILIYKAFLEFTLRIIMSILVKFNLKFIYKKLLNYYQVLRSKKG